MGRKMSGVCLEEVAKKLNWWQESEAQTGFGSSLCPFSGASAFSERPSRTIGNAVPSAQQLLFLFVLCFLFFVYFCQAKNQKAALSIL